MVQPAQVMVETAKIAVEWNMMRYDGIFTKGQLWKQWYKHHILSPKYTADIPSKGLPFRRIQKN